MVYVKQVSNSKLETYRECGWKYYAKYHDKLPEKREDTAFQFGSYIHKVLELGINEFALSGLEKIANEQKSKYKFDKSYNKIIPKCLVNFLEFNTKLAKSKTIGQELKEEFELDDIVYVGIIDRVLEAEDGSILIIDYKTSKHEKNKTELYTDPQLIGYALAINRRLKVPFDKITCAHYYPITNTFVSVKYSDIHKAKFIRETKETVWKMRKKSKDEMLPIRNKFCDWCGVQYSCALFNTPQEIIKNITEAKAKQEQDKLNE